MPTVTSTVGFGKTYSTLAAWAIARAGIGGPSDTEVAECYSGANLGGLNLVGPANSGTWTAGTTLITVNSAHRHNGKNAGTTGVAFCNNALQFSDINGSVTVQYLRLHQGLAFFNEYADTMTGTALGNLVVIPASVGLTPLLADALTTDSPGLDPILNATFVNNVVYWASNVSTDGIVFTTETDGATPPTMNAVCVNNSVRYVSGTSVAVGIDFIYTAPCGDTTAICWNNAVDVGVSNGTSFRLFTDGQPGIVMDDEANASSDGEATTFGQNGAGSHSSTGPLFVSGTDMNLFIGSTAVDIGKSGASVYGANPDAIGTSRPQGAGWDMGALELPAGSGSGNFFSYIIGAALSRIIG